MWLCVAGSVSQLPKCHIYIALHICSMRIFLFIFYTYIPPLDLFNVSPYLFSMPLSPSLHFFSLELVSLRIRLYFISLGSAITGSFIYFIFISFFVKNVYM